jgi:UDP:flavonoid glycosyltransferase YjiC (YdhE family)
MKKALFIPVGIGLAHTGRLVMIARELQKKEFEVVFGAGGDASSILSKEKFRCHLLPEFERSVYEKKLRKHNPFIYSRALIEKFVKAELSLYEKEKPDVIIYDSRLTAKISAAIARIPCIAVDNVDTTPYYDISKIRFPLQTPLANVLPKRVISLLCSKYPHKFMRRVAPVVISSVLLMEKIRLSPALIRLGFRLSRNPYQFFLGDLTLLCDIPEFRPIKKLPKNVKMVGPISWDGGDKLPDWAKEITDRKNIIYVTAAGTGDKNIFLKTLEYLAATDFTIVATCGNTLKQDQVKNTYPRLYMTDYLPANFIMPKAKLVIFPGGNSTAYQALSFAVPQIVLPYHIDQEDNANHLERLKCGITINPHNKFSKKELLSAVGRIIVDREYRDNAKRLKDILSKYSGAKKAAEEIANFI